MKTLFLIFILISSIFASSIQMPNKKFLADGSVTDFINHTNKLYVATDASNVNIFDIDTQEKLQTISVSKITDFMGDTIDSKIYSVDVFENKVLILSQAQKGARRVHIYEDGVLTLILPYTKKLYIAKARFLDSNTLLLGLLSNEIISYNIKQQKQNYVVQVSGSKFSDFVLNEKKSNIIIADESGDLKIHSTIDGSFIQELSGQNLDNVFQVDIKNNVIATAGQDRRTVIYNLRTKSAYYKKAPFLIYSVGLSPSALRVAYAYDENNNVSVFNTQTKKNIGIFGDNKMTLSKILFIDENNFLVSSDSQTINKYTIK